MQMINYIYIKLNISIYINHLFNSFLLKISIF